MTGMNLVWPYGGPKRMVHFWFLWDLYEERTPIMGYGTIRMIAIGVAMTSMDSDMALRWPSKERIVYSLYASSTKSIPT